MSGGNTMASAWSVVVAKTRSFLHDALWDKSGEVSGWKVSVAVLCVMHVAAVVYWIGAALTQKKVRVLDRVDLRKRFD